MRINKSIMLFNTYRNLDATDGMSGKSPVPRSSGRRINRPADDASGSVISQSLRARALGLRPATRNSRDGVSVVRTAEGALAGVHTMLNRVRDRLEWAISNSRVTNENLSASESQIHDTDIALEMVTFTRNQMMLQAGTAMLAHASAAPQTVLRLLQV